MDKSRSGRAGNSLVLGKARFVSCGDLEVARAKWAEKEVDRAARKSGERSAKAGCKRNAYREKRKTQRKRQRKLKGKSLPGSCWRLLGHNERIVCLRPGRAPIARMW
jgi:hypothetical protein